MGLIARLIRRGSQPLTKSEEVAGELLKGTVENQQLWWGEDKKTEFSASLWSRFQAKWRLYCEATVLAALISRAGKDDRYWDLTKAYGKLIHDDPLTPQGAAKLARLDAAMRDINLLLEAMDDQPEFHKKAIRWNLAWFEEIGEFPRNPLTCVEFGLRYLDFRIAVEQALEKMDAEGIVP